MKDQLYNHALFVRNTLELCKKNNPLFSDFPYGYCSKASLWLYDYLYFNGFRNMEFRMRMPFTQRGGNHVWLFLNGYNIDITSDQFNSENLTYPSVYVDNKSDPLYNEYDEIVDRHDRVGLDFIGGLISYPEKHTAQWNYIYDQLGIEFKIDLE